MFYSKLFLNLKSVLAESANGAFEVLGDVLPLGSGGDAVVGVADCGVVFISTGANVFHNFKVLLKSFYFSSVLFKGDIKIFEFYLQRLVVLSFTLNARFTFAPAVFTLVLIKEWS